MNCPQCNRPMQQVGKFWVCGNHPQPVVIPKDTGEFLDQLPEDYRFVEKLPTPLALPISEYVLEQHPYVALHRLTDSAELITRFLAMVLLADVRRQGQDFPKALQKVLAEKLERPSFGAWLEIGRQALQSLKRDRAFLPGLKDFWEQTWAPLMGSGTGDSHQMVLALRNLLAHSGRLPEDIARELLESHRENYRRAMAELAFLQGVRMIARLKGGETVLLRGLPDPSSWQLPKAGLSAELAAKLKEGWVYLINEQDHNMELFPLSAYEPVLVWREERGFEEQDGMAPQLYLRYNASRNLLEFTALARRFPFAQRAGELVEAFQECFPLKAWRAHREEEGPTPGVEAFFQGLQAELGELFVGRGEELKRVKQAIKETRQGVLWISGRPGVGKSAFMHQLYERLRHSRHYHCWIYFFRLGNVGCSEAELLNTLRYWIGRELGEAIELAGDLTRRRQQLRDALQRLVEQSGRQVVLLLDGVDEIYRREAGIVEMPFEVQVEGVVWVCAGRPDGDLQEVFDRLGARALFGEEGLPPLDESSIRAMLTAMLERWKYELFSLDDADGRNRFVETLTARSQGLSLYVRLVVEDVKAGRLGVEDWERLPEGLDAYYQEILERLRVSDVGTVLTPLFCLLAIAREPLSAEMLDELLRSHHLRKGGRRAGARWEETFRRALNHGHMMLQSRVAADGHPGWTIYHDSFRQHLLESSAVAENREWARERWLEVCGQWKVFKEGQPGLYGYALRHYVSHLLKDWQAGQGGGGCRAVPPGCSGPGGGGYRCFPAAGAGAGRSHFRCPARIPAAAAGAARVGEDGGARTTQSTGGLLSLFRLPQPHPLPLPRAVLPDCGEPAAG